MSLCLTLFAHWTRPLSSCFFLFSLIFLNLVLPLFLAGASGCRVSLLGCLPAIAPTLPVNQSLFLAFSSKSPTRISSFLLLLLFQRTSPPFRGRRIILSAIANQLHLYRLHLLLSASFFCFLFGCQLLDPIPYPMHVLFGSHIANNLVHQDQLHSNNCPTPSFSFTVSHSESKQHTC